MNLQSFSFFPIFSFLLTYYFFFSNYNESPIFLFFHNLLFPSNLFSFNFLYLSKFSFLLHLNSESYKGEKKQGSNIY